MSILGKEVIRMSSRYQQRHYKEIAQVFKQQRESIYSGIYETNEITLAEYQLAALIGKFVILFKADNPKFKADRFWLATELDT